MENLFELGEKVLRLRQERKDIEDYSLLDIVDMAVIIRKRLDRLEYFKNRYRRKK